MLQFILGWQEDICTAKFGLKTMQFHLFCSFPISEDQKLKPSCATIVRDHIMTSQISLSTQQRHIVISSIWRKYEEYRAHYVN